MHSELFQFATKFVPETESFRRAYDSGFRHAEFHLKRRRLEDSASIVARSAEYPLRYALHFPNQAPVAPPLLQAVAALYRALDCRVLVIHPPMAALYGLELLAIHPEMRLGVENGRLTRSEFEAWAQENRWLTLDVEHLWKYTLEDAPMTAVLRTLRLFLERCGDRLIHVHLPGYRPGNPEHRPSFIHPQFVEAVWDLLAETRFRGMVVSETNPEFQNVRDLGRDIACFRRWQAALTPSEARCLSKQS
jgi:hypothetical protein